MIRVCPHSDSKCAHGMGCAYTCATDAYDGNKNLCAEQNTVAVAPCPFCKSAGRVLPPKALGEAWVKCDSCQATAPAEAWNRRARPLPMKDCGRR